MPLESLNRRVEIPIESQVGYLLSDGEPSVDTNAVLSDLKLWLKQRRNSCVIHTTTFLMGQESDDPRPRKFMAEIAAMTDGVFRCINLFTPLSQEFNDDDLYNEGPDFDDDVFVGYLHEKLRDVPLQLLKNAGLRTQRRH